MKLSLSRTSAQRLAPLMIVMSSVVVAIGAYLQAIDYPFISDDNIYITNNTKLAGLHLTELWRLFTGPYNTFAEFLPLRDFSYWLDMALFGQIPSAFRLHNIVLYLLCLPLVYGVTLGIWRHFRPVDASSGPWAAATVTALFALHPSNVEAVVWISGRKYILPNLFAMIALWFAINTKREQHFFAPYAAATLVAFAAVMLSKASYVTVAPVIALLWIFFWFDIPAPNRRRSQLLWPLAILLLAMLLVRVFIASSGGKVPFYFGIEAVTRTLAVLGWLARLSVSPESRHFFYPVFEDPYLSTMAALGAGALAAAVAGAVLLVRQRSLEGFAWVAFVLLCVPYIHLIPYSPPSLVSDRWLALAIWPAILLLVALSWRLKPLLRIVFLLVIAFTWGFQTIERPRDWRSFETVIDADLRAFPEYYMPAVYKIIAVQLPNGLFRDALQTANGITVPEFRDIMTELIKINYVVRVESVSTGSPQKAMARLWELELEHQQPPAQAMWNSPIFVLWEKRRFVLVNAWKDLATLFPGDVSVRYNAGLSLLKFEEYDTAVAQLRFSTESQRLPENVRGTAFKNLGLALLRAGHVAEAEAPLRAALEQSPPNARAYCLLSEVYVQAKRLDEAGRAEADCRSHAVYR